MGWNNWDDWAGVTCVNSLEPKPRVPAVYNKAIDALAKEHNTSSPEQSRWLWGVSTVESLAPCIALPEEELTLLQKTKDAAYAVIDIITWLAPVFCLLVISFLFSSNILPYTVAARLILRK